jgi:hypothetical protein
MGIKSELMITDKLRGQKKYLPDIPDHEDYRRNLISATTGR